MQLGGIMELSKQELFCICGGGFSLSGTLLNSIVRGINAILELGRSLGSSIRRIQTNSVCPM